MTRADGRGRGKRRPSGQTAKTVRLDIHEERTIAVGDVPEGSRFLGHRAFTVQDLKHWPAQHPIPARTLGDPGRPSY
jgi:hypothetical protein